MVYIARKLLGFVSEAFLILMRLRINFNVSVFKDEDFLVIYLSWL